jgi:hypothetical protein
VIPLRRSGCSRHYDTPPQVLRNMISSTHEGVEELKHGLSQPRGAAPSPSSLFTIPSSQFGELPLELGGFRDVLDLHTPDPLHRRQSRGASDLLLVSAFD